MDNLTTQEPPKPKRLQPKQKKTIEYWLDGESETFGNLYKSAVKAGFRPKYALNITSRKPKWLYETVESTLRLEQDHIINGVQKIATGRIDSRSVDDTRLKAYELLGRYAGLDNSGKTTINIVQPILGGQSMKHSNKRVDVDLPPNPKQDN